MSRFLILLLVSGVVYGEPEYHEAHRFFVPPHVEPLSPMMTEYINSLNTTWKVSMRSIGHLTQVSLTPGWRELRIQTDPRTAC